MIADETLKLADQVQEMIDQETDNLIPNADLGIGTKAGSMRRRAWLGDTIHKLDIQIGTMLSAYPDNQLQPVLSRTADEKSMVAFMKSGRSHTIVPTDTSDRVLATSFEALYCGKFRETYLDHVYGKSSIIAFILKRVDVVEEVMSALSRTVDDDGMSSTNLSSEAGERVVEWTSGLGEDNIVAAIDELLGDSSSTIKESKGKGKEANVDLNETIRMLKIDAKAKDDKLAAYDRVMDSFVSFVSENKELRAKLLELSD
jgi:hypothetical protein